MTPFQRAIVLSAAVVLAAPVGHLGAQTAKPAGPAVRQPAASAPMAMMTHDARMQAMHDMRDKMAAAKTPEERQALMADHMQAMGAGMQMMKGMPGMCGMAGMAGHGTSAVKPMMGGMPCAMGTPADMARHHQSMEARVEMMQTMMEMMMQRMPARPAEGK